VRRLAIALAIGLELAAPRAIRAERAAFPVEVVAAIAPEGGKGNPVLVGRSGQLYVAGADRIWRRRGGGGVSADVRAAVRSPTRPAEVIAAGDQAPLFRFAGSAWNADLVGNRGPTTLARGGGVPALAIGRHVYTFDKDAWVRRVSAGKVVTALWADGPKLILVATGDGALARWDGKRLTPIKTGLVAGDPLVLLVGSQPRQVFGRSKGGRWIRVSGTAAASVALDRALDGFDEQAAGVASDGALLLAGTLPAPGGGRKAVLARGGDSRVAPWQDLWALADGDRFAVVFAQGGELLVASRAGSVRVRSAAGAWSEGRVVGDLPPAGARARRVAPARAR
jgi:hypothetical protein